MWSRYREQEKAEGKEGGRGCLHKVCCLRGEQLPLVGSGFWDS